MFIDVVPNGRSAPAVLLRESFREGRKVHKRTIANLSQMPPALIDGLRALLAGGAVVGGADQALEIRRSLPHGHVAAALGMMRKLEIPRLLGRRGSRERDLAVALIAGRVIAPGSKLSTLRGLNPETATSSLGGILELGTIEEREIYAALDWLGAQQRRIERQFAKRHLRDGTLVLYDVSSSYLEGRHCELAHHGYSRDHRPDRPQIVYGLLCDREGRPVAVEVFEGNTADPATISAQVEKLKRRFHLERVVLVGDRGMITTARILETIKPAGLDWISCLRAGQIQDLAEGPLQMSLFDERDIAAITSPDYPGERLIACRNAALASERRRKREAALDGIYVIRTSVSADVMTETEAVSAYKDLSRVERAFRTLKSVDLAIRPVHHWLSPRVRAHVFICMMAYYVEWHLRDALKPLLFQDHDRSGAEAERSSPVAPAAISPAADRKRGRRRNDQNLPISSFTDLMAHLATQTLNTAALPKAPNATFTTQANPTPLQTAAFALIGIDPMRVQ
jgi:hypothetical protein